MAATSLSRPCTLVRALSSCTHVASKLPHTAPASTPLRVSIKPPSRLTIASERGIESLSTEELKLLLNQRGVVYEETAERDELLGLLNLRVGSVQPEPVTSKLISIDRGDLHPKEANRVAIFQQASPSVAFIQTIVERPQSMFNLRPNQHPLGAGSGFVWDEHGHIVTNYHVVNGGALGSHLHGSINHKIMVKLAGTEEEIMEAKVVGWEPDKDLAVLKVDPATLPGLTGLTPIRVGASSNLLVGQDVVAIGNPFGLDLTLTTGVVSALGRDIDGAGGRPIRDCVQTDAAINPGNSGGPLLDSHGRLIGMNTMIYAPNGVGANIGIGFAIPVDTVRRHVEQIIKYGPNARPSLGVSVLPDHIREQYAHNLRRPLKGALIAEVVPGSPAASLQLQPCERKRGGVLLGDIITAVNGIPVTKNEDLLCAVEESDQGEPICITVHRHCDPSKAEKLKFVPVQRKVLVENLG